MPVKGNGQIVVGQVLASGRWSGPADDGLARLLRSEGVDLLDATSCELARGTPVYVDAGADVVAVQRLMAANHIRSLPVVEEGHVVGTIDLVELALMGELD